jgi:formylglycine-generating enzyme
MLGNVWEWVYDRYGTDYYKQSPLADPTGPFTGRLHVLRGAAWDTSDPKRLRVTFRYDRDASSAGGSYGFRCALGATE